MHEQRIQMVVDGGICFNITFVRLDWRRAHEKYYIKGC